VSLSSAGVNAPICNQTKAWCISTGLVGLEFESTLQTLGSQAIPRLAKLTLSEEVRTLFVPHPPVKSSALGGSGVFPAAQEEQQAG